MLLRNATRTPMFMGIDAKAFMFIFPTLFFINTWTILFDIFIVILFFSLKIKKLEVSFAYRRIRSATRGLKVSSRPWWFLKKWRNRE